MSTDVSIAAAAAEDDNGDSGGGCGGVGSCGWSGGVMVMVGFEVGLW